MVLAASSIASNIEAQRRSFAEDAGVEPCACTRCGVWMDALERVRWQSRRSSGQMVRKLAVSALCQKCAKQGGYARQEERRRLAKAKPLVDFMSLAERTVFPGRSYHSLTPVERRVAYIVARRWWLETGYYQVLQGFDIDAERQRLAALTVLCRKAGIEVVIPPFPHAEDYAQSVR